MPDEPTETPAGAAVATEEPPPSDLLPKDSAPSAPAAEQEPGDDKPESAASGPEDEGDKGAKAEGEQPSVRDQLVEKIKGAVEADPELLKELMPEAPEAEAEGPDTSDLEEREAALNQRERTAKRGESERNYQSQTATLRQGVGTAMQAMRDDIARQAKNVVEQGSGDVAPNWNDLATSVDQLQKQSVAATWNYVHDTYMDAAQDALAAHPSAKHLDAKDRQKIKDASETERLGVMLTVQLDAAMQRGATATTKAAAKQEAEDTAGLADRLKGIDALLSQNGTGKRAEAGGKGAKTYKSRDEVHAAHANDEITTDQARRLLAGMTE